MNEILKAIQKRHSYRVPFDPDRPPSRENLRQILEAARWAPTAHNMQNYNIAVVDDKNLREEIGSIKPKDFRGFPQGKLRYAIVLRG